MKKKEQYIQEEIAMLRPNYNQVKHLASSLNVNAGSQQCLLRNALALIRRMAETKESWRGLSKQHRFEEGQGQLQRGNNSLVSK
jgi:hypothetical protein